jgi:hypothetical protein
MVRRGDKMMLTIFYLEYVDKTRRGRESRYRTPKGYFPIVVIRCRSTKQRQLKMMHDNQLSAGNGRFAS